MRRYVDDFFGCLQPGCAAHGMQCFAELVRLLLGTSAVSDKKLGCSNPLTILGLDVEVLGNGMTCFPSGDKVIKWLGDIDTAMSTGSLTAGAAGKLTGGLSWSAQNMFHRLVFLFLVHHAVICCCALNSGLVARCSYRSSGSNMARRAV